MTLRDLTGPNASPAGEILVRVEAPHFVAGFLMRGLICTKAALILKWAVNKDRDFLRSYFAKKGWKATVLV